MDIKKIPIIITGGHFSPALAVIEELQKRKRYDIYYLGRKIALEGDRAQAFEYQIIRKIDVSFFPIITGRFQRTFTKYTLFSLLKLPIGLVQSFIILGKIKPRIVMTFGGYIALPIAFACKILGIPIIVHEQTKILGLTNRLICKFAKVLCLSWENTKFVPNACDAVLTGNPIRQSIKNPKVNNSLTNFGNSKLPLIFVTGGSSGSRQINQVIYPLLSKLLNKYRLFHQCGQAKNQTDYQSLSKLRQKLSKDLYSNYKLVMSINPEDMGDILSKADLVIGRSGANTITEILYFSLPAILIPLSHSAEGEQLENAKFLKVLGIAEIIENRDLNSAKLLQLVEYMMENLKKYQKPKKEMKKHLKIDAAWNIVQIIERYI